MKAFTNVAIQTIGGLFWFAILLAFVYAAGGLVGV